MKINNYFKPEPTLLLRYTMRAAPCSKVSRWPVSYELGLAGIKGLSPVKIAAGETIDKATT